MASRAVTSARGSMLGKRSLEFASVVVCLDLVARVSNTPITALRCITSKAG